jgi:hypothetical protein
MHIQVFPHFAPVKVKKLFFFLLPSSLFSLLLLSSPFFSLLPSSPLSFSSLLLPSPLYFTYQRYTRVGLRDFPPRDEKKNP